MNPSTLKFKRQETGQIMLLLAISLVVLLAFVALAIDGGMIYNHRRTDQNGADASALAGGGAAARYLETHNTTYNEFSCSKTSVLAAMQSAQAATIQRAATSNYTLDTDLSDNNGVNVICREEDKGISIDKYIDVKVKITTDVQTSFAHLIFSGPVRNTVEATVRVHPRAPSANGYAVVSLSTYCSGPSGAEIKPTDGGLFINGNADIEVHNGGMFSYSCFDSGGTSPDVSVIPPEKGIHFKGDIDISGHPSITPWPDHTTSSLDPIKIPLPRCTGAAHQNVNSGGTIDPGNYDHIKVTNGELVLNPGLYCMYGDFDIGGSVRVSDAYPAEAGVTIYLISGDFKVAGNAYANLKAPKNDSYAPAIRGVVIYMDPANHGQVSMLGNTGSEYTGTVYVPSGLIEVGGTSGVNPTYRTQLLGYAIKLHGDLDLNIYFEDPDQYSRPAYLDMHK